MAIGASEAETFWTEFLRSLARRGLRGVKLVISDDHKGLKAAATRILGATWQRCRDALRPQPAGPCRPPGSARRLRLRRHRLRPGGRRQREGPVASGRRPAQAQGPQAGSSHGRSRARRPRLHELPQESTAGSCIRPTRSNGSMPRSSARTNVVGISPTKTRSHGSSAPSLSSRTTTWAVARRYMTLESIAPLSDGVPITLPTSWQPERPGPTRREPRRAQRSYTSEPMKSPS